MTTKEIVQYWINNRIEMRAFIAAPEECQTWLKHNLRHLYHLNGIGNWEKTPEVDNHNQIMAHCILSVHKDAANDITKPCFTEYDIDADGMFTHKYAATQVKKTYWYNYLEAIPHIGLFGGWFFSYGNNQGCWSTDLKGINQGNGMTYIAHEWIKPLVPTKIRFYK